MSRATHDLVNDHFGVLADIQLADGTPVDGDVPINNGDGTSSWGAVALPYVLTGTADPSAGGGVAHPMPAMYLRNNSNVTELWLATGTGDTAWSKQTSP